MPDRPLSFSFITEVQAETLRALVRLCEEYAGHPLPCDLEDTAVDFGVKRFFFYYKEGVLVHAAWFTAPGEAELDLYLFTHPAFRGRGYCKDALNHVRETFALWKNHPPVYLPACPSAVLLTGLSYSYSDYLMQKAVAPDLSGHPFFLPNSFFLTVTPDLSALPETGSGDYLFRLIRRCARKQKEIGHCLVSVSIPETAGVSAEQTPVSDRNGDTGASASLSCFLSHVFIKKRYRNRGFGTLLIASVLDALSGARFSSMPPRVNTIRLHLDSRNLPALRLYQKLGFEIAEQIDMWELR